ncbi:hypothetical protein [Effusibacillus dendaii]|uniref:Uncharacterized protein n=1 Tax=Effusibacillus dendaii TaxID=2743772 RepID=A0A7I8DCZ5_9BACL|nr:hypothetical protein [Effusibacillus dendaii]BCJ86819.1 hypothetical protein skT53_18040 [Effusibacillus dendaii]
MNNQSNLAALENELKTIRQEINQLRTMAERIALQEQRNYQQISAAPQKTNEMHQVQFDERQATVLLNKMRQLCEHMNQHLTAMASNLSGNRSATQLLYQSQFQSQYPPQHTYQPQINHALRPEHDFSRYPYNGFTT